VAKYQNKKETQKIGRQIRKLRIDNNLLEDDIAFMTGFAKTTISSIEDGSNTDTSHLIEIAKAIGVHPMELFNVPFDIKPRHKLPSNKINRVFLTSRIKTLVDSGFFKTPKLVKDVVEFLSQEAKVKVDSTKVSVILKRQSDEGKLKFIKQGRKNLYSKKRN
jgi:transcriptional regulator with XRE-family HTH domain